MSDETSPMSNEDFQKAMSALVEQLAGHMENAVDDTPLRTYPDDTRMMDLPKDTTPEESLAMFGSEYDDTTVKLKQFLDLVAPGRFEAILNHVPHVLAGTVDIKGEDTIAEARAKGTIIDIVTVGLLAHDLAKHLGFGLEGLTHASETAAELGFGIGVIKGSDLLNGMGRLGELASRCVGSRGRGGLPRRPRPRDHCRASVRGHE